MTEPLRAVIRRLGADDLELMAGLAGVFAHAFDDPDTYLARRPGPAYLRRLLGSDQFFALVACAGDQVVGALAAYELVKFEQARSEIYIYDLAVLQAHRRRGIASALILELQALAAARGAWVIYVQADHGDEPAIALYTKLGVREDVLHFDIAVGPGAAPNGVAADTAANAGDGGGGSRGRGPRATVPARPPDR